ncbi:MAG: c-type cytochrome [Sphingomonadales bacterium]|nr:c-type cytochrome [Sphingomonadales bacterium]
MSARLFLLAAVLVLAIAAVEPAPNGTAQGVYTAAQADAGAQAYAARCAVCHGADLAGTWEIPALKGRFIANWGRARLSQLHDYMGHAMPQFAPGTLDPQDDSAIIAFLLRENGAPAGATPLPIDKAALARISIDPVVPR